jgi:SpoVK/Ycf46/Vps4 family AAA+-type ATPase
MHALRNYAMWGLGISLHNFKPSAGAAAQSMQDNPVQAMEALFPKILALRKRQVDKINNFSGCLDLSEGDGIGDVEECAPIPVIRLLGKDNVRFDSIIGNQNVKDRIIDSIIAPCQMPLMFEVQRNFLFYGSPGTGKTMFAKAAASELQEQIPELDILFFAPRADEMKGKYVGETEKKITSFFRSAECMAKEQEDALNSHLHGGAARKVYSIIFIDEIDSLARDRSNDPGGTNSIATNALLQMMDGFQRLDHVLVVGATNYPWVIDSAIRSRFNSTIHIDLPGITTTCLLLKYYLAEYVLSVLKGQQAPSICGPGGGAKADDGKPEAEATDLRQGKVSHADLFASLSQVIGVTNDELNGFAKQLADRDVPYSPDDVKNLCANACADAAQAAQSHKSFHRVGFDTNNGHRVTDAQRSVLQQMDGMYASARTYELLRRAFPECIDTAAASSLGSGGQQPPERFTVGSHPAVSLLQDGACVFVRYEAALAGEQKACWDRWRAKHPAAHIYVASESAESGINSTMPYCLLFDNCYTLPFERNSCYAPHLDLLLIGSIETSQLEKLAPKQNAISSKLAAKQSAIYSKLAKQSDLAFKHASCFVLTHSASDESRVFDVADGNRTAPQPSAKAAMGLDAAEPFASVARMVNATCEELDPPTLTRQAHFASKRNANEVDQTSFNISVSIDQLRYTISSKNEKRVAPSEQRSNIDRLKRFEETGSA